MRVKNIQDLMIKDAIKVGKKIMKNLDYPKDSVKKNDFDKDLLNQNVIKLGENEKVSVLNKDQDDLLDIWEQGRKIFVKTVPSPEKKKRKRVFNKKSKKKSKKSQFSNKKSDSNKDKKDYESRLSIELILAESRKQMIRRAVKNRANSIPPQKYEFPSKLELKYAQMVYEKIIGRHSSRSKSRSRSLKAKEKLKKNNK